MGGEQHKDQQVKMCRQDDEKMQCACVRHLIHTLRNLCTKVSWKNACNEDQWENENNLCILYVTYITYSDFMTIKSNNKHITG